MPVRRSIVGIVPSGEETASVETCPSFTVFGRSVLKAAPAANLSSVRLFTSTVSSFAVLRISSSGIETDSLGFFDSLIRPALLPGDYYLHAPVSRCVRAIRILELFPAEADRDDTAGVKVKFIHEILLDRLRAALGKREVVLRTAKGIAVSVDEDRSAFELFPRKHAPYLRESGLCPVVDQCRIKGKVDLDVRFRPVGHGLL